MMYHWPEEALAYHERLREAGYTVTVTGRIASITGHEPRQAPVVCPYTGAPMIPAEWAPEGLVIWAPRGGDNA